MSTRPAGADHRTLLRESLRLLRPFWRLSLLATGLGIASGLATAALLAAINRALHDPMGATGTALAAFAGLCLISVAGTGLAGSLNSMIGQRLIANLRKDISARILKAPIAALEVYKPHRLMAVLTNDVDTVSVFTFNFSSYAIALAIILGGFAYLLTLSPLVFALALASLGLGLGINMMAKRGWIRDYEAVRIAQDDLHRQYRAITEGSKELKMSRARRSRVHGELLSGAAERISSLKTRAMGLFWVADAAGSAVFFVVIGLLLAGQHRLGLDGAVISGAVIVLLYVKGPVAQISSALPMLDQARVSMGRIAELSAALDHHEPNLPLLSEGSLSSSSAIRSIALHGVTYAFAAKGGAAPFVLGPIDLEVKAGELIFIVGANGSGKTTLIKLLLGLYVPEAGEIHLDGGPVTEETRDAYRQLFTTVFSDYYLFDDLAYGVLPTEAEGHVERLGLAGKVRVEDGRFSTTDLSTGQRKRLALVHAYLEQRPVIVTDEWAADQDPDFRRLFYEELLPALKAQGRTLIVISHDDRYFHIADRIVRMVDGHVADDRRVERVRLT